MMANTTHAKNEPIPESARTDGLETEASSEQQAREEDLRLARERAEALLDEALRETFPASDPIAVTCMKHDAK